MFTVSFLNTFTGNREVSRYVETKRAAQNWAKWLVTQKFASRVYIYRGPEGGELLQEMGA